MKTAVLLSVALLATAGFGQALKPVQPDLGRLAGAAAGQVFNRSVTVQKEGDRTVARLDARAGDGSALLDGVLLGEGVIEVDLRGKDVAQQSFLGIAFHVVDWTTYDAAISVRSTSGRRARSSVPTRSSTSRIRSTPGRSFARSARASSRKVSTPRLTRTPGSSLASFSPTRRSRCT